jgi:hypothetical protein
MSQRERARRRADREAQEKAEKSESAEKYDHFSKAEIAEAIHRALCDITRSDGFMKCHYYACLGYHFFARIGFVVHWLAGGLAVFADPSDPTLAFAFDPELGRQERGDFAEAHSWLMLPYGPPVGGIHTPDQYDLVDFSSRHYKRYAEVAAEQGRGEPVNWKIPDPPAFIWERADRLPYWVRFRQMPAVRKHVLDEMGKEPALEMAKTLGVDLVLAYLSEKRG